MKTALVLAAHGSHHNAQSSDPARQHAAALRRRGIFDQVIVAFWKEFPSFRDVPYLLEADQVYIVPLFMADGYFSGRVVPRELGLEGAVTHRAGQVLHYTAPVGTDPRMVDLIRARVAEAVGPELTESAVSVVLIGHGTVQNRQSKQAVLDHVAALRQAAGYAEVLAAYMEEPPTIPEIHGLVAGDRVVVVPLFVADGMHTAEDIPRELGLPQIDGAWQVPGVVDGKTYWYTSSVGTSPYMTELILDRVAAAGGPTSPRDTPPEPPSWATAFADWLATQDQAVWLEVAIDRTPDGYRLRHREDAAEGLRGLTEDELRQVSRTGADGEYRPLPTAAGLPRGWCHEVPNALAAAAALDDLYPATIALWHASDHGTLETVNWRAVQRRQTGMMGLLKRLDDADAQRAIGLCCSDHHCLRQVRWEFDDGVPAAADGFGPVPCPEPCSLLLSFCRQVIGWRRDEEVEASPLLARFVTTLDR